jgi:hypothetical protein
MSDQRSEQQGIWQSKIVRPQKQQGTRKTRDGQQGRDLSNERPEVGDSKERDEQKIIPKKKRVAGELSSRCFKPATLARKNDRVVSPMTRLTVKSKRSLCLTMLSNAMNDIGAKASLVSIMEQFSEKPLISENLSPVNPALQLIVTSWLFDGGKFSYDRAQVR